MLSQAGTLIYGTTNPQGVRAHTISSARLADVQLPGVSVSEAGINAAIAGHFTVPVIMVSGDDVVVKETTALLGEVEGATVKWASGFHSAKTLMPEAAYQLIREKVKKAIGRIGDFKPYKLKAPIRLDCVSKITDRQRCSATFRSSSVQTRTVPDSPARI